jgi:transposase
MAFLHQQPVICLGVDIAKGSIIISDGRAAARAVANNRRAICAFLNQCRADFIVCEPTGGHERLLLEECRKAGIPVHRADTLKLKAFIRSFGTLGKSDAIDAAGLAAYGRERWARLALWSPPDPQVEQLQRLTRRRNELLAMKVAEQNRAKAPGTKAPGGKELAASFKAMLAMIGRQIAAVDAAIAKLATESSRLRPRIATCISMDGIGLRTATALLGEMPELGSMTRRQAAALAGLAPHPNESGQSKAYRKIRGGRPGIATILFMPALRAAGGQGPFAAFYKRLVDNGKKPIVAIAAVMRKIIITLNARIRDNMIPQS